MDIKGFIKELDIDLSPEAMDTLDKAIFKMISDGFVKKELYKEKLSELESAKLSAKTAEESLSTAEKQKLELDGKLKQQETVQKKDILLRQLKAEGAKPGVANLLMKELDLNSISVEDGKVSNWQDILGTLKGLYQDAFEVVYETGTHYSSPPVKTTSPSNPFNKEKPDLLEQSKLYRKNPELAKKMALSCGIKL